MGCSPSKNLSLSQVNVSLIEETIPPSTRFLENCLIIWFCDETSNKFENEKEQLRKYFYGLKTFNNIDACIAFITNIQDEKIFLIISGARRTLERFCHLPQLEKIYIFDLSSQKLSNEKYRTIKHDIVRDVSSLYNQLQEDIKLCEMDFVLITVAPVPSQDISFSSNLTKQQASFLFAQMIKEILYRLKLESGSKDVLIDFCRVHYKNSIEQLCVVDEFAKHYRPHNSLWWLTNPCFISRILNRVQRTREIDIIYKLGFFIKQAHIQLNHLHEENALQMENISVVYRGKTMTCDEFDGLLKNNSDSFLSFSNFLTATTSKAIAVDFVDRRLATHPGMMGIIFEIYIDHTIFNEKNPFALLKDMNMNKDEVCFHMSTVFRVESIEQPTSETSVTWSVKLKSINNNDQQLLRLVAFARSDDMHANPVSYLGKLLIDMGDYRRAEQFFFGLLQDPSVRGQPRRLVRTFNGLGALYTYKNEYVKALDQYQQSLQISLIYLQPDHPDLAPIYKSIGDSYLNQCDYIQAVENYEKAIELLKHGTQHVHHELITDLYTLVNTVRQLIKSNRQL
jgi:hypothetical protein